MTPGFTRLDSQSAQFVVGHQLDSSATRTLLNHGTLWLLGWPYWTNSPTKDRMGNEANVSQLAMGIFCGGENCLEITYSSPATPQLQYMEYLTYLAPACLKIRVPVRGVLTRAGAEVALLGLHIYRLLWTTYIVWAEMIHRYSVTNDGSQ